MKKLIIALLCFFALGVAGAEAESVVYVFMKNANNMDVRISCDGKEICDLNGPIKKTMDGNGMFKVLYKVAHPTFRKLVFDKEGKVAITVDGDFTNAMNCKHTKMKGEIQLDLEDGETYYLDVAGKGINDIQIKIMQPKKAEKNINDKKWKELPAVTVAQ